MKTIVTLLASFNLFRLALLTSLGIGYSISQVVHSSADGTRNNQAPVVRFDHLSLVQGLSQSTVNAIVQDGLGFMWFGTQDGLNRFDGYSIVGFKHNIADTNSISDNGIWCLLRDNAGDLWIGTMRGGLNHYAVATNRFSVHKNRPEDLNSISENNVTSLFQDSQGQIWAGTLGSGLNRYDSAERKFVRYVHDASKPQSISDNTIWSIVEDHAGHLWIATWDGLCRVDMADTTGLVSGEKGKTQGRFMSYRHDPRNPSSLSGNNIRTLYVDRQGTLWIGTWGTGLNRLDLRSNTFKRYRANPRMSRNISNDQILSISEDGNGSLWIGTGDGGLNLYNAATDDFTVFRHDPMVSTSLNNDIICSLFDDRSGILWIGTGAGGVNWYDRKRTRFPHFRDDQSNPDDIDGNDVWAITEAGENELWIGTYGKGVNRFDPPKNRFVHYKFDPSDSYSISHNNILSICATRAGDVWIGTEAGGLNRFDRARDRFVRYRYDPKNTNSLARDEVTRILEDSKGDLWIGTNGGGVDRLEVVTQTFHHYVTDERNPGSLGGMSIMALFEDRQGFIWIGTWGGGVGRYDRETDSFVRFRNNPDDPRSLNNNTVLSLFEDREGAIWMGTLGGGLNRFDRNTRAFTHYTESDGLPNNVIYGILPDDHGNLWLSTNKGVSKFNLARRVFKNYDVSDGLQGNEFNQGAYYRGKGGRLFFGGINGFNAFFPDSIRDNPDIPPVMLTSFKVFDVPLQLRQSITTATSLSLGYDQNFFSIEFVALNYTSPEKNNYAYMLEGLDENWVNAGTRRYASYTNLDPGSYTLRVKGSNNDDVWNDRGVAVEIVITPPYWKTWWFRGIVFVFLAGVLFLMYRYRVRKLLEIERIRASIATDLHDDIGSTLTEIALFSDVGIKEIRSLTPGRPITGGEAEKVTTLLEEIGRTSRTLIDSMNDIVWAIDPKNDSFEYLLLRMKTHAARMLEAKGINYDIEIPAELSELELPLGFRRRFFLIFKEAVNNIIKHAHPTKVQLAIKKERSSLIMTVADNGVGFDPRTARQGNGLRNMQERATSLGGSLSIASSIAGGTTITLRTTIP